MRVFSREISRTRPGFCIVVLFHRQLDINSARSERLDELFQNNEELRILPNEYHLVFLVFVVIRSPYRYGMVHTTHGEGSRCAEDVASWRARTPAAVF